MNNFKKWILILFALIFGVNEFTAQALSCNNMTTKCDAVAISGTPPNIDFGGFNTGCFTLQATRVVFYRLRIATPGLFTFNITPNTPADYDWAVWKNGNCLNLKTTRPDRASFAGGTGPTGLNLTAMDTCEGAGGDRYCSAIPVVLGDEIIICIDLYSSTITGFNLSFGTGAQAPTFNCSEIYKDFYICDANGATTYQYNMSTITNEIQTNYLLNQPHTYSYFDTENDAVNETNPLPQIITVTAPERKVYVKVKQINGTTKVILICTIKFGAELSVQNSSLSKCSPTPTTQWDLTQANPNLSATPGVTYTFYTTLADAQAGNANSIATPANYTSGNATIYVLIKTASCSKIAELQLNMNVATPPSITSPTTILCQGASIVLTSSSPTNNVWSTGETTQSITVTAAGTYSVKFVNGLCESTPASIDIVNDPNPIALQIQGNASFCQGTNTVLTSNYVGTNLWSTGETTQSITVTAPGTYTLTATNQHGCSFTKDIVVTQESSIVATIAPPQAITCTTSQITLNAEGSTYATGNTFQWVATNGGTIVSGGNTLTPIVSSGGTYSLTITGTHCNDTKDVQVTQDIAPPTVNLVADRIVICSGESASLTSSGAVNYQWTGFTNTGNSITVSPTTTTIYYVKGIGANGCVSTEKSIEIQVVPAITSTLSNSQVCTGDVITLNAGTGVGYTYLWEDGSTSPTRDVNAIGNYTVTINNGVCSKSFTSVVSQAALPVINEVIYGNNSLTIIATNPSTGILEYSIDGVNWQDSKTFSGLENNATYPTMVRVKGTSCLSAGEYFTFYMPNVITPNGDGYNDMIDFTKVSTSSSDFSGLIFDRYGKKVYTCTSASRLWDGKLDGRVLPSDTYWYKLEWTDSITHKKIVKTGWILLKNR